jgi:hypothetical protein
MDTPEVNLKKSAINYGLILGGILAGSTALMYAINIELLANWWLSFLFFFVTIAVGIVSVAKSKSLLKGYISFKQGFTSYFITIAIGLIIGVALNIIIFNIIDPEGGDFLKTQALETTEAFLKRIGTPKEAIEEAMKKAREEDSFGVLKQLQAYAFQLAFYSIFGLLVSLIMKRKESTPS